MAHVQAVGEEPTSDDKTFGLIAHLSTFVFPWVGPILLFLVFKDKAPYVKYHAVQILIFQLVAAVITGVTCGLGGILFLVPLWGAYKAYQGDWEGYPLIASIGR